MDFLPIYATRVARMIFLRHKCGEDHPTLVSEIALVEMARSRLREQILSGSVTEAGLAVRVRELVVENLRSMVRSEEILAALSEYASLLGEDEIMRAPGRSSDLN